MLLWYGMYLVTTFDAYGEITASDVLDAVAEVDTFVEAACTEEITEKIETIASKLINPFFI